MGYPTEEDARVLVVIMNNLRDFDILRREGWYRIPVKKAPPRLGADYLAFYQTRVFGDEKWAVNYYAPVRRYRLVRRRELLPDEADHPRADDWYYKIEIGPLQKLPHPVPSRSLRRITFIPTTLKKLLTAREINDLWCGSEAEERLWEAFREEGLLVERRYRLREGDEYGVDFAFFCRDGRLAVLCEDEPLVNDLVRERPSFSDYELAAAGWDVIRLESRRIVEALPECLALVREALARRGGVISPPAEAI